MDQPRLLIHMKLTNEMANYVVMKLMQVPNGPTFTVRRRPDGDLDLWLSKRTNDALRDILADARANGEF